MDSSPAFFGTLDDSNEAILYNAKYNLRYYGSNDDDEDNIELESQSWLRGGDYGFRGIKMDTLRFRQRNLCKFIRILR